MIKTFPSRVFYEEEKRIITRRRKSKASVKSDKLPLVAAIFHHVIFKALLLLVMLLSFLPLQSPVKKKNSDEAFEHNKNLQSETDNLLFLFDNMPRVPVFIVDEPLLRTGTNTEQGAAYAKCYAHDFPVIYVKKIYYQKANQIQLTNSLKHELTHAWLCRKGLKSAGHGEAFRRKFTEIGGVGN